MSKPTIVLVPGAWHTPDQYVATTSLLQAAGFKVNAVALPSVGSKPAIKDFKPDVDAVREAIITALDNEEDVQVVCHSYGGLPASEATQGLSKKERIKDGKRSGVRGMSYICAFAADKGVSLYDALGGGPLPWMHEVGDGYVKATDSANIFYNDLPEEAVKEHIDHLQLHCVGSMKSKATYTAWRNMDCSYLVCEDDNAIPAPMQEQMIQQKGARFTLVEKCKAGHGPFLSVPQTVVNHIRRAAGETL